MNFKETAKKIVELVGGEENIISLTYCVTRLRFELKDRNKADVAALENLEGIMGIVNSNMMFQIIIGTDVVHVYDEIKTIIYLDEEKAVSKASKNPLKVVFDIMVDAINPIVPLFLIAGVLAALISIFNVIGILPEKSSTYLILSAVQQSVFFFLPIFVANSTALKLNVNPYIAMALAAVLVSTSINGVEGLDLFGIKLTPVTYSNSILPIFMAVWFMSFLDKKLDRIITEKLRFLFKPLISILITLTLVLFVFGPMGTWLGNAIASLFSIVGDNVGNWLVIAILAAIYPLLIITGAGGFLIPVILTAIAELGYDPIIVPGALAADITVGAVTLAIALRAHKPEVKQLATATGISALLGVTEPANYGVLMKFKRPYIATAIGGACGGLFAGLFGLKGYTIVTAIVGITGYIGPGESGMYNFYIAVGTVVISFVTGFVASWFLSLTPETNPKLTDTKDNYRIKAPVKGDVIPLNEVSDRVFASQAIGKGVAIKPKDNSIVAPFDATVTTLFPTNHAIGLTTSDGVELLIHIGIDTVNLNGEFFKPEIQAGDKVAAGQKLMTFDYESIAAAGYDNVVIYVITNTAEYKDVVATTKESVNLNDEILSIELKEAI